MRSTFFTLFAVSAFFAFVNAIKFDLAAVTSENSAEGGKCLSQYIAKDNLVLVTVNVGEGYNQRVELEVKTKQFEIKGL